MGAGAADGTDRCPPRGGPPLLIGDAWEKRLTTGGVHASGPTREPMTQTSAPGQGKGNRPPTALRRCEG